MPIPLFQSSSLGLGASCPDALWSRNSQGVWLKGGEFSNRIFQTLLVLPLSLGFFFSFSFFFCNQSGMVAWTYL